MAKLSKYYSHCQYLYIAIVNNGNMSLDGPEPDNYNLCAAHAGI